MLYNNSQAIIEDARTMGVPGQRLTITKMTLNNTQAKVSTHHRLRETFLMDRGVGHGDAL